MAIIVDQNSRIIIQGITGASGSAMAERMCKYYSNMLGGVSPGKGGQTVAGRPVFDFVHEAVDALRADTSAIVVPAPFAKEALMEAVDAGIKTVWVYSDRMPLHETIEMIYYAKQNGVRLIGPNAAGVVSPGRASISDLNEESLPLIPGKIGLAAKSGSLNVEAVSLLHEAGYGFSSVVSMGGEPFSGTTFTDVLQLFKEDEETDAVIMLGEIGGSDEVDCIPIIQQLGKPLMAYISGHTAPQKKTMGHAGAIASSTSETAEGKSKALRGAGIPVADYIEEIPDFIRKILP